MLIAHRRVRRIKPAAFKSALLEGTAEKFNDLISRVNAAAIFKATIQEKNFVGFPLVEQENI